MLVWHHCDHVFARSWTRQSRPSPFFPRVNNFLTVTTNACCRFRQARGAFTTADGKVAESARCCPLVPSRCFAMMIMVSLKIFSPSLSARCLPSSWPDTASFRSCLLLPPGFLDTLAAGNCARSRACTLFSQSSRLVSARDNMCPVVSESLRGRSLHAMLKYESPAIIVKLFFTLSSFPGLLHSFRPYIRDALGRARNVSHPGAVNVPSRIG